YAPDGVRLWARRMGAADADDVVEAVAVDRDGNAYVAGAFAGDATWQGGSRPDVALTSRGGFDGFLARYDAAGDLVWVEQVGGAGDDAARGVDVDPFPERQVLLAGGFEGTATLGGGTTLTSAGGEDAFVARYTAEGELLWARRGGGPEDDGAWSVSAGEFGEAYVVGTFNGEVDFGGLTLQSRGSSDAFAVGYDEGGTALWAQQIGGVGSDFGQGGDLIVEWWGGLLLFVTGSFEEEIVV